MAGRSHYEVLQVTTSASTDEIRKAYHKLARQHHPDRFRDPEEKTKAELMFTAMTDAFNVLTDATRRREYDLSLQQRAGAPNETPIQREAKTYAKVAQVKLAEGDTREALRLAKAAVHLDGNQAVYWALLAQTEEAARNFAEAARAWDEAVKREADNARYYRMAGQCLEKAGMLIRARRMYEHAVRCDRSDGTSAEALRRLSGESKDDGKKAGGLLGGLFKRS